MKNKSLIFSSVLVFTVAFATLFFNSCEKDDAKIPKTQKQEVVSLHSKEIKVSDNEGNYIVLRIQSSEKDIVDSYSEKNYALKALTQEDIDKMNAIDQNIQTDNDLNDIEDFVLEGEETISVYEEIVEENISSDFVTYMLTVEWHAPDEFSSRGFDWQPKGKSPDDYAYLKNERCCWAIYYKCDVWIIGEELYTTEEAKLSGKDYKNNIGKRDSQYIQLHIKYRKDKHFSFYYHN